MTTAFKQQLALCGLSNSEAAEFFGVSLDTVKSWCAERNPVSPGAAAQLTDLWGLMDFVSDEAVDRVLTFYMEKAPDQLAGLSPGDIEFSYSGDHGHWPSARCAMTVEALARLKLSSALKEVNEDG